MNPRSLRDRRAWVVALALLSLLVGACGRGGIDAEGGAAMDVTSSAITAGGDIPVRFTCDGEDRPPDLAWSGAPADTVELAVVVDDPDAPGGTFTHWTVWGLEPDDSPVGPGLPSGAVEGTNDFGEVGYRGPCPPRGDAPHGYRFRVLALDTGLDLPSGAEPGELAGAVRGHVTAEGRLRATYGR